MRLSRCYVTCLWGFSFAAHTTAGEGRKMSFLAYCFLFPIDMVLPSLLDDHRALRDNFRERKSTQIAC